MSRKNFSLPIAALALLTGILAPATMANAATLNVAGTTTEVLEPPCEDPVITGVVVRCHTDGHIEIWAGGVSGTGLFDEDATLNLVTGRFQATGSETITDACIGDRCGTLELTWHGSGLVDLETFALISADGQQTFTGGTGDLEGAKGSTRFSLVGDGLATYGGSIVL